MGEVYTRPLLPLRGLVVFPGIITNVDVGREKSLHAVEAALNRDKLLYVTTQKNPGTEDIGPEDLYTVGVLVEIKQSLHLPNGGVRILVQGLRRVEFFTIDDAVTRAGCFVATGCEQGELLTEDLECRALEQLLREAFEQWLTNNKKVSGDVLQSFRAEKNCGRLTDMVAYTVNFEQTLKQTLLSMNDVKQRLRLLYEKLVAEVELGASSASAA